MRAWTSVLVTLIDINAIPKIITRRSVSAEREAGWWTANGEFCCKEPPIPKGGRVASVQRFAMLNQPNSTKPHMLRYPYTPSPSTTLHPLLLPFQSSVPIWTAGEAGCRAEMREQGVKSDCGLTQLRSEAGGRARSLPPSNQYSFVTAWGSVCIATLYNDPTSRTSD